MHQEDAKGKIAQTIQSLKTAEELYGSRSSVTIIDVTDKSIFPFKKIPEKVELYELVITNTLIRIAIAICLLLFSIYRLSNNKDDIKEYTFIAAIVIFTGYILIKLYQLIFNKKSKVFQLDKNGISFNESFYNWQSIIALYVYEFTDTMESKNNELLLLVGDDNGAVHTFNFTNFSFSGIFLVQSKKTIMAKYIKTFMLAYKTT